MPRWTLTPLSWSVVGGVGGLVWCCHLYYDTIKRDPFGFGGNIVCVGGFAQWRVNHASLGGGTGKYY